MVGAQRPGAGLNFSTVFRLDLLESPQSAQDSGAVVTGGQSVGVIGAQHTGPSVQDDMVLGLGFRQTSQTS